MQTSCRKPNVVAMVLLLGSGMALSFDSFTSRRAFVSESTSSTLILASQMKTGNVIAGQSLSWDDDDEGDQHDLSEYRYGSSSLDGARVPLPTLSPTFFPKWIEGYWQTKYKFQNVKFIKPRSKVNLQTAGIGQGSCLSLPNIGNSPSTFVTKYLFDPKSNQCYEDSAYNTPRRFEAFCPGIKVTGVQVGIPSLSNNLSPKCSVTGEGCLAEENPFLHHPTTRVRLEFDGPTRRGIVSQSIDATILSSKTNIGVHTSTSDHIFAVSRKYSQYNQAQELQTFYKEIISLSSSSMDDRLIDGQIRVVGYDVQKDQGMSVAEAAIVYDYSFQMHSIEEDQALQI